MLKAIYTRAPRPVTTVVFFGQGRFRRFRDGVLITDPERPRDPHIVIDSTLNIFDISDGPFTNDQRNITTTLTENGVTLASIEKDLTVCIGRRRPNLRVYIIR